MVYNLIIILVYLADGKFGLPEMIGAMLYAMPSMPHTARKYNPINPDKCFELRRLVCIMIHQRIQKVIL